MSFLKNIFNSIKKKPQRILRKMGCANGKSVLTTEDLDYIANHTAVSREEVEQQHKNFLESHPDGKITKSDFRKMMQACYPSTDTEKLGTLFRNKRFMLDEIV